MYMQIIIVMIVFCDLYVITKRCAWFKVTDLLRHTRSIRRYAGKRITDIRC